MSYIMRKISLFNFKRESHYLKPINQISDGSEIIDGFARVLSKSDIAAYLKVGRTCGPIGSPALTDDHLQGDLRYNNMFITSDLLKGKLNTEDYLEDGVCGWYALYIDGKLSNYRVLQKEICCYGNGFHADYIYIVSDIFNLFNGAKWDSDVEFNNNIRYDMSYKTYGVHQFVGDIKSGVNRWVKLTGV